MMLLEGVSKYGFGNWAVRRELFRVRGVLFSQYATTVLALC